MIDIIKDMLRETKKENSDKGSFVKTLKFGGKLVDYCNEKIKPLKEPFSSDIEKSITAITSTFPSAEHKPDPITKGDKDFLKLIYHLNQVYIKTEQYLTNPKKSE